MRAAPLLTLSVCSSHRLQGCTVGSPPAARPRAEWLTKMPSVGGSFVQLFTPPGVNREPHSLLGWGFSALQVHRGRSPVGSPSGLGKGAPERGGKAKAIRRQNCSHNVYCLCKAYGFQETCWEPLVQCWSCSQIVPFPAPVGGVRRQDLNCMAY